MASSIPSQARAVDPFASYNSNTVNTLTRMLTYGENGIATPLSCDVTLDSTSNTQVDLQPGFVYQDDVWINIESQHVVNFDDGDHYYNFDTGFDEAGWYYVVLEYTYAKSRPAPDAKALIVKPSQTGAYTPGGSWLFLKAVEVEWTGSEFVIVSVSNYDPGTPENRRLYIATYAGTEIGLPTHTQERDQGRFVYGMEEDDFFFGLSDRWIALSAAAGASYEANTSGFSLGDLVYTTTAGNLQSAISTLGSTTADGIVTKVGALDGRVQTSGRVENVKGQSGDSITVGKLIYLSKTEPGKVTTQQPTPLSQFTGRCIGTDSTNLTILFHRGEPLGAAGTTLATYVPQVTLAAGGSWISSGGLYYQDVDISDIDEKNALVTVWDDNTGFMIEPENIEFVSTSVARIWMPVNTETLNVFMIGPAAATIAASDAIVVTSTLASGGSWLGGGPYYQDVDVSSIDGTSSVILVKDNATGETIVPSDIEFVSANIVRVWMPVNTETLDVVAVGATSTSETTTAFTTILASGGSWTLSGGSYFQDVDISLFSSEDVVAEFYDIDTDNIIVPNSIDFSSGNMRVWMPDNTHQLNVTIIG